MSIDQRLAQPRERIEHKQEASEDVPTPNVYEAYNIDDTRDPIEATHGTTDEWIWGKPA